MRELGGNGEGAGRIVGDRRRREHLDGAFLDNRVFERTRQRAMLDEISAGLSRFELVVEAKEMWSEFGIQRAIGDVDREDGLGLRRNLRPHAEHIEQLLGRSRSASARGSSITRIASRRFIDQRDAEALGARASASASVRPTNPPPGSPRRRRPLASCFPHPSNSTPRSVRGRNC
jgi:hypothetical protein